MKASSEYKSSTEGDPADSHELSPIKGHFVENERRCTKNTRTRHSVHFINHGRLDKSILNGKTDLLQSRFLSNHKKHTSQENSPKSYSIVERNFDIDSNQPGDDLYLTKQVNNNLYISSHEPLFLLR